MFRTSNPRLIQAALLASSIKWLQSINQLQTPNECSPLTTLTAARSLAGEIPTQPIRSPRAQVVLGCWELLDPGAASPSPCWAHWYMGTSHLAAPSCPLAYTQMPAPSKAGCALPGGTRGVSIHPWLEEAKQKGCSLWMWYRRTAAPPCWQ